MTESHYITYTWLTHLQARHQRSDEQREFGAELSAYEKGLEVA